MRRAIAPALVALVMVSGMALADAMPATAQGSEPRLPTPRLRVLPGCIEPAPTGIAVVEPGPTATLRVLGSGLGLRQGIALSFVDANGQAQSLPGVETDGLGTFDRSVTIDRPFGTGGHRLVARDAQTEELLAVAVISAPCRPVIVARAECFGGNGPNAGRFRSLVVRGRLWPLPGMTVTLRASRIGESSITDLGTVEVSQNGVFRLDVDRPGLLGLGRFRITAGSSNLGTNVAAALVEAPCAAPAMRLRPDCAPAGPRTARWNIRVTAGGFTPSALVLVLFDPARSHEMFPVQVGQDGRIDISIRPRRRPRGEYRVLVVQDPTIQLPAQTLDAAALSAGLAQVFDERSTESIFAVPCPIFEEAGEISVRPACGPPRVQGSPAADIDYRVVGSGFRQGPLEVRFDVGVPVEETHRAVADASGDFVARFTTRERARSPVAVAAVQTGSVPGSAATFIVTAEVAYLSPCDDLTPDPLVISPDCGQPAVGREEAYALDVAGSGFIGPGLVFLMFEGSETETGVSVEGDGSFDHALLAEGLDVGPHELRAIQRRATADAETVATATAIFVVPCPLEPEIAIDPSFGPAGYATRVVGEGFPPDTVVIMRWDRGIEADRDFTVDVDADGTFSTFLFILPNDFTGERQLSAVVRDQVELYPVASATYVVGLGTGMPPGSDGDDIIDRR